MSQEIAEVISKAVYSAIKDMSLSEIRELAIGSYMDIRLEMQNDHEAGVEA